MTKKSTENRLNYSTPTLVRKSNRPLVGFLCACLRVYYFFCGIHLKTKSNCGKKIPAPAIVLCNHGSFIDFYFAGSLLWRSKPHFVSARLYFYHKWLSALLKLLGAFPKSMFAMDTESVKNCIKVLKSGELLAMMPEARLSTVGKFEDIQPSTFSFLKKSAVPVYTIKICGDYFADPKWGKGMRRGATVEAELDLLFTPEDLQTLSVEEIGQKVCARLDYNDFTWLESRPDQRYRSKNLAEGLENILRICPICKKEHTLSTAKREIFCAHCGKIATLNDRYGFDDFIFKNFAEWYDWQKDLLRSEILADPDYALTDQVELRLPSKDGKSLTRSAGSGICTLDRSGLTYRGTRDGEEYEIHFPLDRVYRLLFGAGVNFEIYNGVEILYFVPKNPQTSVDWYLTSMILYDET